MWVGVVRVSRSEIYCRVHGRVQHTSKTAPNVPTATKFRNHVISSLRVGYVMHLFSTRRYACFPMDAPPITTNADKYFDCALSSELVQKPQYFGIFIEKHSHKCQPRFPDGNVRGICHFFERFSANLPEVFAS